MRQDVFIFLSGDRFRAKGEGESCFFALLFFLFYEHFSLPWTRFYCVLLTCRLKDHAVFFYPLLSPVGGNCNRKVVELTILQPNVRKKYFSLIKPVHLRIHRSAFFFLISREVKRWRVGFRSEEEWVLVLYQTGPAWRIAIPIYSVW